MTNPLARTRGRLLALAAVTLTATLVLTGCGRSADAGSTASTAAIDDKPATGTVTLWAPDGDANALKKTLASYEKANPDLDLKVTIIPEADYNTKLQTAISSGTAPDIAYVYTEAQTQFLATKAFAPVPDDLVDSSSFFTGAWEAGQLDGTQYSVPWYVYTRLLIYRKDLAEAGNATVPTTWSESPAFYKALQAGGATKGFGSDVGFDTYTGQTLALYAYQAGATLLNSDSTKWDFDNQKFIDAVDYYAEDFKDGTAAVDSPGFLDAQPYLVQGKTGSMISGPWVVASLDTTAKKEGWTADHIATAVLPSGADSNVGSLAGGSWLVSAKSDNADSSWKVIREMSQQDVQIAQFKAYGSMPAVQAAWSDSSIADNHLYDAFLTQLKNVKVTPQVSTWNQVSTAIGKEMEAVARGTETASEAAKNLQSQADSIGVGD